mgnify:CR=1 FL=1
MKISLDIDGVFANFTDRVKEIASKLFPGKIPEGYIPTDWYYSDIFSKEDLSAVFNEISKTQNFWLYSVPYPENVSTLNSFLEKTNEHDIYFVTSRAPAAGLTVANQTRLWLEMAAGIHRSGNFTSIIPVASSKYKADVMRAAGIQYSLDDHGPTVEECNQVEGHQAFLLDRPWNRDREYGPRLDSVQQFFDIVTGKVN